MMHLRGSIDQIRKKLAEAMYREIDVCLWWEDIIHILKILEEA